MQNASDMLILCQLSKVLSCYNVYREFVGLYFCIVIHKVYVPHGTPMTDALIASPCQPTLRGSH